MTALTVRTQMQGVKATFGDIAKRADRMVTAEKSASRMAADVATRATRANWHPRRESIPPRHGRSSTGGQMAQSLVWHPHIGTGLVRFDHQKADKEAPHWIIQEIGTGKRATLREAGVSNPRGRPGKGATYVRTVPSQIGRRIKGGLVFASGGRYSPTGSRRDEQLAWASTVIGAPARPAAIKISKEIRGQHMVQRGAEAGFSEYSNSVLGAARQAFQKGKRS